MHGSLILEFIEAGEFCLGFCVGVFFFLFVFYVCLLVEWVFLKLPVRDHKCLGISFNSVRTCISLLELRALKCSSKLQF